MPRSLASGTSGMYQSIALPSRCWLFLATPLERCAQHLVRGGRAIGGDDVDIVARAALLVDRPDEVEQLRVHAARLRSCRQSRRKWLIRLQLAAVVAAVPLEGELALLAGVAEEELQRLVRLARLGRPCREGDDGSDQKADRKPKAEADRKWRGRMSQNAVALWISWGSPFPDCRRAQSSRSLINPELKIGRMAELRRHRADYGETWASLASWLDDPSAVRPASA